MKTSEIDIDIIDQQKSIVWAFLYAESAKISWSLPISKEASPSRDADDIHYVSSKKSWGEKNGTNYIYLLSFFGHAFVFYFFFSSCLD